MQFLVKVSVDWSTIRENKLKEEELGVLLYLAAKQVLKDRIPNGPWSVEWEKKK